jgi:hypothetical protein
MASNRSNAEMQPAARAASADTPKQALTALARHGARLQIAVLLAAGKTLADWAQSTDRYTHAVGDELLRRVDGESDSAALIARVAAATGVHLRELSALPHAAATHFDTRLTAVPTNN